MKKIILVFIFTLITTFIFSQTKQENVIYEKDNIQESVWDNGIPIIPDDENIMSLIYQLNQDAINDNSKLTKEDVKIYRELGVEFYNKGMYQEADFYLSRIKNYTDTKHVKLKEIFKEDKNEIRKEIKDELEKKYKDELEKLKEDPKLELTDSEKNEVEKDREFVKKMPSNLDELSKEDLETLSKKIDGQIKKLTRERDDLIKNNGSQKLIDSKNTNIKSLNKEKEVIDLNIDNEDLKEQKTVIKRWLWTAVISIAILVLFILVLLQRKTIKVQDVEIEKQLKDINNKNTYLEHAAKIIRHDMHSGINTYIPRGINSLEKRLTSEDIKNLKIEIPLKMIKEGLMHTQKVYKSVYEFTNLVKQNVVLDKKEVNLKTLLDEYLINTSYGNEVIVKELVNADVNSVLFCNAIDNLIKNGLKYNDSDNKEVVIFMEGDFLIIEDNGRGLSEENFDKICTGHVKNNNKENEIGLGLNICVAILNEHGFSLSCEKVNTGTKMKIKIK